MPADTSGMLPGLKTKVRKNSFVEWRSIGRRWLQRENIKSGHSPEPLRSFERSFDGPAHAINSYCSKNIQFMNNCRRVPYGNASKSDSTCDRAKHCKLNSLPPRRREDRPHEGSDSGYLSVTASSPPMIFQRRKAHIFCSFSASLFRNAMMSCG
jgi:hypothetical protein